MKTKTLMARIQEGIRQRKGDGLDFHALWSDLLADIRRLEKFIDSDPSASEKDRRRLAELKRMEDKMCRAHTDQLRRARLRRNLPEPPPRLPEVVSEVVGCGLSLVGFEPSTDRDVNESIRKALERGNIRLIFQDLGFALGCMDGDVLILETREGTRRGKNATITRLRFPYNEIVREDLEAACAVWFDKASKSWALIVGDETEEARALLREIIRRNFLWVIDIGSLAIFHRAGTRAKPLSVSALFQSVGGSAHGV